MDVKKIFSGKIAGDKFAEMHFVKYCFGGVAKKSEMRGDANHKQDRDPRVCRYFFHTTILREMPQISKIIPAPFLLEITCPERCRGRYYKLWFNYFTILRNSKEKFLPPPLPLPLFRGEVPSPRGDGGFIKGKVPTVSRRSVARRGSPRADGVFIRN